MGLLSELGYPTVAELEAGARTLTECRPGLCSLRRIGVSRAGRPLRLLSVGHARRAVLVVAGAHANEPNGGSTVLALAERVARERELRSGVSWHFVLCADPDGASLHTTPAPRTLLDYHLGFFRPAGPEQPEWSPSVLPPDRLPPETHALFGVLDELRPYLQVTLHGTDLGGSWVQLTRNVPGLAEPFAKSAAELGIPVERSASDAAGWPVSGPGVFVMPRPGGHPAYPSMPDDARHSTWYHAHRYGGLTAVVEVPMWASDLVDDIAPHPAPAAALRHLARRLLADAGRVERVLAEELPRLRGPEGPMLRAARWALALVPGLARDWTDGPPPDLSTAYVGSVDAFGRRLPLRAAAMLRRVLADAGAPGAPFLEDLVAEWCESFADRFRARRVPLADQVEHQVRTVLAAAACARGDAGF
ncbi:M14 family zinc carboxypeptidase [Streptomyces scabiei]|uniref:M14 family zinc carboxypeptidase n=1 Tax=Streptomyces scabiei TaxID=1930 RepID=UPI001B309623|nr:MULTISPECIES: M14 family zinc carboxypeptidase [Streptomyces]MBP5879254.1 3-hydroxyacyl-CoA dehydrogenase [Streptomyces sp. LBUM 1477]MBP5887078.1 3-hydroxyacyl-CoA dehydrogenase [Streptomyces sp. LBUM 1487]MBP5903075.1 3-hydroxyacyl-CoA dehydrogenase [Streptomyces sp. LBUM 1488]MDW8476696.1 M14 family zinc carboxypeptidase [Streptomyces scabiei]MDX2567583.1 M14 family zinc carboxypeptidase [Streptomyces scabiei]